MVLQVLRKEQKVPWEEVSPSVQGLCRNLHRMCDAFSVLHMQDICPSGFSYKLSARDFSRCCCLLRSRTIQTS